MEKNILLRKSLFLMLILILVFPFLHILYYVSYQEFNFDPFLLHVVKSSFFQAFLSTSLTLFFAFLGSLGLLSIQPRVSKVYFQSLKVLLIIPSFTPPLMVIILSIKSLGFLPLGLKGVVFFHSFMNIGLVSLLFFQIIERKSVGWFKQSLLSGVSIPMFILKGLMPELKMEAFRLSVYFMILYFFSFSIPLIVGGAQYGGPEVFILEKILSYGQWSEALHYSVGLFFLLFLLSSQVHVEKERFSLDREQNRMAFRYFNFYGLSLIPLLPTLLLLFGLMKTILSFSTKFEFVELFVPLKMTFIVGLLTGLLVFLLMSLIMYCYLPRRFNRWIDALMNPGWVVIGFSLLLMGGDHPLLLVFKLSVGLSILFFPFLFRLSLSQKMQDLSQQVRLSEVFPVSWNKIFLQIIYPQSLPTLCFLSGLAALWACGDFALSGILLDTENISTLALAMKELISNYRMEKALVMLLPLLVVSLIVFLIFQGLGYVCRRKIFTESL